MKERKLMNDQLELFDIVSKCVKWNSERYDQVFNKDLSIKLLDEEVSELFNATDVVSKMDAIGDIMFVAIGVLWKAGVNIEDIKALFYTDSNGVGIKTSDSIHAMATCDSFETYCHETLIEDLKLYSNEEFYAIFYAIRASVIIALGAARALGVQRHIIDIVDAICDSNATKEVKGKTDPAIKANIFKGHDFVPPTVRLEAILLAARG